MDLVTRYYEEMWNRWDCDLADELLASEFVFRGSLGHEVRGRDEFKSYMRLVQAAFSDFHNRIEQVIACGNHAVARIKYPGIAIFHTDGKQLLAGFVVGDRLTLFQQVLGDSFWSPCSSAGIPDQDGIRKASGGDVQWCADLMARSEPWITLRRDRESALGQLADRSKELYVAMDGDERLGFGLIDMRGPFAGYIQSLCVAAKCRNCGHGTRLLRFAEGRILRDEPNVFLCVSSFNADVRRFYERHEYESVGELQNFIITGASEVILRKSVGLKSTFMPANALSQMNVRTAEGHRMSSDHWKPETWLRGS